MLLIILFFIFKFANSVNIAIAVVNGINVVYGLNSNFQAITTKYNTTIAKMFNIRLSKVLTNLGNICLPHILQY